jgi:hypothetical protein
MKNAAKILPKPKTHPRECNQNVPSGITQKNINILKAQLICFADGGKGLMKSPIGLCHMPQRVHRYFFRFQAGPLLKVKPS